MKQRLASLISALALAALSFTELPPSLIGRWQNRSPKGVVGMAIFRADSTYGGFVNGKQFVSGTYFVRQDTVHIQDGACGAYYGTYKLTFVTADSIRFAAIEDRCQGRRQGSDGLTLGRIRPGQTK